MTAHKKRQGEDQFIRESWSEITRCAHYLSGNYKVCGYDPSDDYIAVVATAFLEAYRIFDVNRSDNLSGLAWRIATNNIISESKRSHNKRNQMHNNASPLDAIMVDASGNRQQLIDSIPDPNATNPSLSYSDYQLPPEWLKDLNDFMEEESTEIERKASRLVYAEGLSYKEAANALGVECKSVDNALSRAKRKGRVYQENVSQKVPTR